MAIFTVSKKLPSMDSYTVADILHQPGHSHPLTALMTVANRPDDGAA